MKNKIFVLLIIMIYTNTIIYVKIKQEIKINITLTVNYIVKSFGKVARLPRIKLLSRDLLLDIIEALADNFTDSQSQQMSSVILSTQTLLTM